MHGVAAVAHFGQSAALTYLIAKDLPTAPKWPITRIGWEKVLSDKTVRFPLGVLLPIFPFLSSVNHFAAVAAPGWYEDVLQSKVNWLRWTEYSLSAGVMVLIIAILSGVNEMRSLVSLAILNVVLQMMGLMIEKRKAENASRGELVAWLAIAWGVFLAMWTELIIAFQTILTEGDPPAVVYSIIWTMFTLFSSFGLVQTLYVFDVMSFESYEASFIGLSLGSKSLLSWLVYGGVIAADARFEEDDGVTATGT
jgi:hypothetical protein